MATVVVRRLCRNPIRLYVRSFCVARVKSEWALNANRFNHDRVLLQKILPNSYNLCQYATEKKKPSDEKKLSLLQKFKQMYRDYWYVLVPVHVATSCVWVGGFYYLAKSGIDIVAIMESWHISETIISPLRDSSMGYFAVTYALYKIATPFRYMVTLGGTTFAINYLKNLGYIKPVPSAQELKVMYKNRRDHFMGRGRKRSNIDLSSCDPTKDRASMVSGLEKKVKMSVGDEKSNEKKSKTILGSVNNPNKIKTKD